MGAEGIWKVELLGPYGWEAVSTAFLENGRYLASSQDHYVIGRYQENDGRIEIDGVSHSHGNSRTMFGSRDSEMELHFEGEIKGDEVRGQAEDRQSKYSISFRARRLADLE